MVPCFLRETGSCSKVRREADAGRGVVTAPGSIRRSFALPDKRKRRMEIRIKRKIRAKRKVEAGFKKVVLKIRGRRKVKFIKPAE
jgi:hypothetical protein